MRRPTLLAPLIAAALALVACADDPGSGSRSLVYHPVGDGGTPLVARAPAGNVDSWEAVAPGAPDVAPNPPPASNPEWVSSPPPANPPDRPSGPTVPTAPSGALDPATHIVPPIAPPMGPSLPPGAMAAGTSDADPYFKSFLGTEPPELPREGTWLNTGAVLSLAGLRGKVVLLYFSFLKCGACPLMRPYLHHWHDAYGPKGLAVVYVDNGRADLLPEVKSDLALQATNYPVFYDVDGKAIAAFAIRAFPTAYLIGKDGKVLWEGNPVGIESRVEELIVKALP